MKHRDTKPLPIHFLNDLSKSLNILITTVFISVFFFSGGGEERGGGRCFVVSSTMVSFRRHISHKKSPAWFNWGEGFIQFLLRDPFHKGAHLVTSLSQLADSPT